MGTRNFSRPVGERGEVVIGVVIGIALVLLFAVLLRVFSFGCKCGEEELKKRAILFEAATYQCDPQTGKVEFVWRERE